MKSFLLKDNYPVIKWGKLPDNTFFEGKVPEGYDLAINPHGNYVIVDIDNKPNKVRGYDNIPSNIYSELFNSFNYNTNSGTHVWLLYTGDKVLINKSTKYGLDLRTKQGYAKWYLPGDIRNHIHEIKETSTILNEWLEELFTNKTI